MAEGKEKGNGLKIIIIILLVIIALGLGFGGYMIFFNKNSANTATNSPSSNNTVINSANELSPYTYSMDEFLVNLTDDGGKKYFKVNLYLGYNTKNKKNMDKELEEKKPILRDAINSVLRSKKSVDITQKGVEDLKKEILARINPYLENGKAENVYFSDILVQ